MAGIFVFSENTALAGELTTFARAAGKPCTIIAIGAEHAEVCAGLGAAQVICLQGQSALVESYAKAVSNLLQEREAELFAVGATPSGRDLAAKVAGYLSCPMVSDVASLTVEGDETVTKRMMYGGALTRQESFRGLGVVTIPAGLYEASAAPACDIVEITAASDDRIVLESISPIEKAGADLSVAEKVVCVGMGFDKQEDLSVAYDLAETLGGEVGCTRSIAEDRHWFADYIGISGTQVKPRLYIALGVSGQVQHIVGVRDSQIIVAINKDAKAPIFETCDYGIVGDMLEIAPLLNAALK